MVERGREKELVGGVGGEGEGEGEGEGRGGVREGENS